MATPLHLGPQRLGVTLRYRVDLASVLGADVVLSGAETLTASIWPVGGGTAIASPPVTADAGDALIEVVADPALFTAGVYRINLMVAGRPAFPADAFLTILPAGDDTESYESVKPIRSGGTSYCTVAQLLRHVDRDYVGRLVRDDGDRDGPFEMEFSEVLVEALQTASGEVESACSRGELYTPADLAALAASGTNAAAFLRQLVADLACARLRMRRAFVGEMLPQEQRALELLDLLARGVRIFTFDPTIRAGLPSSRFQSQFERDQVPFIADDARFWGNRSRAYRSPF